MNASMNTTVVESSELALHIPVSSSVVFESLPDAERREVLAVEFHKALHCRLVGLCILPQCPANGLADEELLFMCAEYAELKQHGRVGVTLEGILGDRGKYIYTVM